MDPRYTDQEMALILKRAAELQATSEEPVHTLDEIKQIAEQVGIDPKLIADAASALRVPAIPIGVRLFGAPSAYRLSRRMPGIIPIADHAAIIATVRDHMPLVGEVKEFTDCFEWHAGPPDNKTAITLTRSVGATVVRIDGRYVAPKFMLYFGATALTLVTTVVGTVFSPALGVGLGLGMLGLSFASARSLWNRAAGRTRRTLERLLVALAEQVDRSQPASTEPPTPSRDAPSNLR